MVAILGKFIGKGVSKTRKNRKRPASTPAKKKSATTIANEKRQMARQTKGTRALKGLQLEAQRKAKDAKRGVDKKKQAALKKKIKNTPAAKKRRQHSAQIAAIKEERKSNPRQGVVGREGQAITSRNKNPDAVFTSGDNKIIAGKNSSPSIKDNTTKAQENRAKKIVALEKKVGEGTATPAEKKELKRLDKINRDDKIRADKDAAFTRGTPARKAKLKSFLQRGGKVMKKNMGGSLKAPNNPGLAKLPTPVRNKMGFAKGGGKVEYKMGGGKVMGYKKGGKVIKTNMSGDDVVGGCYD